LKKIAFVFDIPKSGSKDNDIITRFLEPVVSYDLLYLVDDPTLKRVLVKDITLDIASLEEYDFIVPVGAEVFKKVIKLKGGVTKFNGVPIDEPFRAVPIVNPAIVYINPSEETKIREAFNVVYQMWTHGFSVATSSDKDYEHVQSVDRFKQLIDGWVTDGVMLAFDTETTSLDPFMGEIIGASFSNKEHTGYFVEKDILELALEDFKHLLSGVIPILMHNSKFDKKFIKKHYNIDIPVFHDTLIIHYLMLSQKKGTHSLKLLAMTYSDLGDYSTELDNYITTFCRQNKIKKEDFNYGMIDIDILSPYACGDVDATLQVMNNMGRPTYKEADPLTKKCYNEIMLPAVDMLMELELAGAPIDHDYLTELDSLFEDNIREAETAMAANTHVQRLERQQGCPFKANSYRQVGELLFNIAGLPDAGKTDSGSFKTDKETLLGLADKGHELPQLILDLRASGKMRGTYTQNIIGMAEANGRVRGTFNLCLTESGRLSSSADTGDS